MSLERTSSDDGHGSTAEATGWSSEDDELWITDRIGGRILALPEWVLLVALGVASIAFGAAVALGPPLFGAPDPTYPDPGETLALAGMCVVTGTGLVSGGVLLGFTRLVQAAHERSAPLVAAVLASDTDREPGRECGRGE